MDLQEDQIIVFNKLLEFLNNNKNEILINSSAGTGKTFLITYFIKHIILNNTIDKNISVCTPTHTSLQELKSKLFKDDDNFDKSRVNLSTVHRFLDYKQKIDKNNEKYFFVTPLLICKTNITASSQAKKKLQTCKKYFPLIY